MGGAGGICACGVEMGLLTVAPPVPVDDEPPVEAEKQV